MEGSYFLEIIAPLVNGIVENVINFLKGRGLLRIIMNCNTCNDPMSLVKYLGIRDGFRWMCMSRTCRKNKTTLSIRAGSPFYNVKSDLRRIVFAIYLWSTEIQENKACEFTGLSKPTVIMIYAFLRDICKKYLENNPIMLGGEGIVCQVDESLFSYKPKYHRGRAPEQEQWVFGIVDTSFSPALGYMECVERRNAETLLPIIRRICLPGSIINSDGWAAYPGIQKMGYEYRFVNHRVNYVDPITGAHTQNIESYWAKQKLKIKKMKGIPRKYVQEYLYEFMWHDRFDGDNKFEKILEHIRRYYTPYN
jgi:ISXO2-like transposase domain